MGDTGKEVETGGGARKRVFSALQPTGSLAIGHYIGAVKNMVSLQNAYDCLYAVADLHTVTVDIPPDELRRNVLSLAATLIASGVDARSALFVQSHVPAHAELAWLLNCRTYVGEARRMTQFKEKSAKNARNVNLGLLCYPALMAADILLYRTDFVPVGRDQKQHLELARDLAARFNSKHGETFIVPEPIIPKEGAKIMSLSNPAVKMSKSDPDENSLVLMTDEPEVIMRKFRRAVTDSKGIVKASPDAAGVTNLLTIYSVFSGRKISALEREFEGKGYGDFKTAVGEAVAEGLRPVREEYKRLIADKAHLLKTLSDGRERAECIARRTLGKAYKRVGLI